MTTRADPTVKLHPVLARFIGKLLAGTDLSVEDVYRPGKPIGGTWRLSLSNGVSLACYYGKGIGGCYWYATFNGANYNLSVAEIVKSLRARILKGVRDATDDPSRAKT